MMIQIESSSARREIKYVGLFSLLGHVKYWLRSHWCKFEEHYPDRNVRSIYFDNFSLSTYENNLTGVSDRFKLRYRWYGESLLPGRGALEVKRRINSLGWKSVDQISLQKINSEHYWSQITAAITAKCSSEARSILRSLNCPIATIGYKRKYFISRVGGVRATVDTDQFYIRQFGQSVYSRKARPLMPAMMTLEFKCANSDASLLPEILSTVPLRLTKNSKYVNAVNSFLH